MLKKTLSVIALSICLFAISFALASCKSTEQEVTWFQFSGKSVFVELEGNYTTGYTWEVEIEGDAVQLKDQAYTPHDAPAGMVGVGGTWKCTLNAACDGNATVYLTYARPWDKTDIAENHALLVTVHDGKICAVEEAKCNDSFK